MGLFLNTIMAWTSHNFHWPPNSPDLNPIENLWAIVQRRVDAVGCKNLDEFQAEIVATFKKVEQKTMENLVSSMKTRLQECIAKGGARTKYWWAYNLRYQPCLFWATLKIMSTVLCKIRCPVTLLVLTRYCSHGHMLVYWHVFRYHVWCFKCHSTPHSKYPLVFK